uniref:PS II complex 12 kDa extrinsic protein n=1 Tax=Grammatophora oceanica TaxID=210454 RepID=A0A7S1VRA8_9STRA|mmetsp:Transcript_53965/g.80508  ORF Transcript_53965/g.80508 Transcript_53965/m.80508 type:complete len:165 (+) Transcript_53965:144-638(+)|eukprot:CAMPEP_0194036140 /NCGR_PEP_ID=MMETSP0009_2-20130614/8505_1 /TAXON_ID=210454 /ORGANISM="Grammatophora oceanica, Strain CCMP 410" /LENGTH=164 /DNA_ID=CAMNT_0038677759 /DNA_START=142 /DNA_END=636 /DNA_ORIENTATION=+
MKYIVLAIALIASVSAFAPAVPSARVNTQLAAKKEAKPAAKPFFENIFGMDLFAPNPNVNTYGARSKKKLGGGKLGAKSYVPAGLSKSEYEKVRSADQKVKDERYAKNVKKAGKFQDYTKFYIQRGTDTSDSWIKSVTRGHDMAKTKYDWSGKTETAKKWAKEQ